MDCEKEVVYLRMEGDFADKKMKPLFTVMTRNVETNRRTL